MSYEQVKSAAVISALGYTPMQNTGGTTPYFARFASSTTLDAQQLQEASGVVSMGTSRMETVRTVSTFNASGGEPTGDTIWSKLIYNGGTGTDDTFKYQGSAYHARTEMGNGSNTPRGTVHGITSQVWIRSAGGGGNNETTALYAEVLDDGNVRDWLTDFKLAGPVSSQTNLLTGLVTLVTNCNVGAVTNGAHASVITTIPGHHRPGQQTWFLDSLLALVGFSGNPATATTQAAASIGATTALQIGNTLGTPASGWQNSSSNRFSKFNYCIIGGDFNIAGIQLDGRMNTGATGIDLRTGAVALSLAQIDSAGVVQAAWRIANVSQGYRLDHALTGGVSFTTYDALYGIDVNGITQIGGNTGAGSSATPTIYAAKNGGGVKINGNGIRSNTALEVQNGAFITQWNAAGAVEPADAAGGLWVGWNGGNNGDAAVVYGNMYNATPAFAHDFRIAAASERSVMKISGLGNLIVNGSAAALATSATDGFLHIPSCAGAPSGVPTTYTGHCAMVYDTTNNRLYVRNPTGTAAWKSVLLS